ncbi:DUF262 domain-containing protein [Caproicibacter fermentans]|nr:DUF262 domain-containing protein [Caproicibacter fermentans]
MGQLTESDEALVDEITKTRNSLKTDKLDMSYGELMSMYEKEELIISPSFQRLFRWSSRQQTRFIESILLGIPIPAVFVAEGEFGKWEVVDGLQRISTVLSFFGELKTDKKGVNKWTLLAGNLIPKLEGYTIDTLPIQYVRNIKRSVCRVEVIKWDSQWDMRYELFSRLNTGGAVLTEQELRNCIFRNDLKEFYVFVENASSLKEFNKLVGLSEKQKSELYDQELIVRFISLVNEWKNVNTSADQHMTHYMQNLVKMGADLDPRIENMFYSVIELLAKSKANKQIFRYKSSRVFSPNLYDAIMVGFANNYRYYANHTELILSIINKIKEDPEFKRLAGSTTYSKTRIKSYITRAMKIIGDYQDE